MLEQAERDERREVAIARLTALKEMNTHLRDRELPQSCIHAYAYMHTRDMSL